MSTRRKLRLARTGAILLVLLLIVWRCTSSGEDVSTRTSTTTTAATTTAPPVAASTATAAPFDHKLPAAHYLAGGASTTGKIILAGGLDAKKSSTDVLWSFDPSSGDTTSIGKLPKPVHTPATAAIGRTTFVMGGGQGTSVFDDVLAVSQTGTVESIGKLPEPRTNGIGLTTPDGKSMLVIGGYNGHQPTLDVLQTSDGKTFTTVATLLHGVRFPAVAMLGRAVWVVGGEDAKAPVAGIQRIDLDSGQVTDVAPLPVALSRASGFTLGGALFVAGGRTPQGMSKLIYRVDPLTGVVTSAGSLPEERSDSTVVVRGKTAYLFGGLTPKASDTIVTITAQ